MSLASNTDEHVLRPTTGTVLQFTPDHSGYRARFFGGDERWTEPVIGWAVVVSYTEAGEYETALEPVVLEDHKYAVPIREYLAGKVKGTDLVGLERPEA